MKVTRTLAPLLRLAPAALLLGTVAVSCNRGGDDDQSTGGSATGPLQIVACSLGCDASGDTISCGPLNVHVNEEIAIEFNRPVDVSTVDGDRFQVVQAGTGLIPPALYRLDPGNPKRVIYRPVHTDAEVLGFVSGGTYSIRIPGTDTEPEGQLIRATDGTPNTRTLNCTVAATLGVLDLVPGAPSVQVFFDVAETDPDSGDLVVEEKVLANPTSGEILTDVYRDTRIVMEFDDIMNPGTLVDPLTNKAFLIEVRIDPDGNVADPTDQVELGGEYTVSFDYLERTTIVTFEPTFSLPSAGVGLANPRKLVVSLPEGVRDMGGNSLANGGFVVGVPEAISFEETLLPGGTGEDFTTNDFEDDLRTGMQWGAVDPDGLVGALLPGSGGGSGRLGELFVPKQTVLEIDTDMATFDNVDTLASGGELVGDPIVVDDGLYEFSTLTVEAGATLRFTGSRVPRVFTRGRMVIDGTLDVSGETPEQFPGLPCDTTVTDPLDPLFCEDADPDGGTSLDVSAEDAAGQAGGLGGPGGAHGGKGGDLTPIDESLVAQGGMSSLALLFDVNGSTGTGVVGEAGIPQGAGGGGVAWPTPFPLGPDDLGGAAIFAPGGDFTSICQIRQAGGNGAGGGGAVAGKAPNDANLGVGPGGGATATPTAVAGGAVALDSESYDFDAQRLLPEGIHGGAGGGGGGSGVGESATNGQPFNCIFEDESPILIDFVQARGAAGGGGGGAVQLHAGTRLVVGGLIDASGGDGGASGFKTELPDRLDNAASGGGGGGGTVLLEAAQVQITSLVDVSGGEGGQGSQLASTGGDGGPGRIQVISGSSPGQVPTEAQILNRLLPNEEELTSILGGTDFSDVILPSHQFTPAQSGPGQVSGAQSCWLRPEGNVFTTTFFEDEPGELGWDMELYMTLGSGFFSTSYRTASEAFPLATEQVFGNEVGASPIVVRFQAARSITPLGDPCNVPETNIVPGTVTPWVEHPAMLNDYFGDDLRRPNMIRFLILLDRSYEVVPGFGFVGEQGIVRGVKSIYIRAQGE